jgi:hypothetical protein
MYNHEIKQNDTGVVITHKKWFCSYITSEHNYDSFCNTHLFDLCIQEEEILNPSAQSRQ